MSDAVKPEDTKPVVVDPPKPAEDVAAVSEPVAAPATTSDDVTPVEPAEVTAAAVGDKKEEEEKPELKEITQGTLSLRPYGFITFFKKKKFLYFQDEPIPEDNLKIYLQKASSTRSTAAHATQTGKGLLLYSRAQGQSPSGIIKLAEVTEVVPSGPTGLILKVPGTSLHFDSPDERDSWVSTIKHKIAEAKDMEAEIVSSEGYKAALKKLTRPTPTAVAKAPEKPVEAKEEGKETEEQKSEEDIEKVKTTEAAPPVTSDDEAGPSEQKADVKRSASKGKKRTSILFFRKKEKVEEKDETSEVEETRNDPKAVEPTTATNDAHAEVPAVAQPKEAEDVKPADETAEKSTDASAETRPVKRHSVFDIFGRDKKEKEAVEEKKEEKKDEEAKPEAAEAKTDTDAVPAETKPVDVDAPEASTTAEKSPASSPPKPKFYNTLFEKKDKKAVEKEPEADTTEAVPAPAINNDSTAAPVEESAAEPASPKEQKRKSSFFSFKKEKKADDVKSDTEEGEASAPKTSTSPAPKPGLLTGLIRKASRAGKGKETEHKEVVAPNTVAEESAPGIATSNGTNDTETGGAPATIEPAAIGDVVPEAVTVGQAHPVQAAA